MKQGLKEPEGFKIKMDKPGIRNCPFFVDPYGFEP